MNKLITAVLAGLMFTAISCDDRKEPTSDEKQQNQQEQMLQEATAEIGMPNLKNFKERKLLKTVLELRDDANLITYTYVSSEVTGKFTYVGQSFGYGIPYATQFTNPQKVEWHGYTGGGGVWTTLPQADPNGLFSPAAADGTWILMQNPNTRQPEVQYIEPKISTFTFKLPPQLVIAGY